MKRVFAAAVVASLLLLCVPGTAVALELSRATVTPVIDGLQRSDGTYHGPALVSLELAEGDYYLDYVYYKVDGEQYWHVYYSPWGSSFTGEYNPYTHGPFVFYEGTHTVEWKSVETDGMGLRLEATGRVTLTVVPSLATVTPVIEGACWSDGTYRSPAALRLEFTEGDYYLDYLLYKVDGEPYWHVYYSPWGSSFTGEYNPFTHDPIVFSEGIHTVEWKTVERDGVGHTYEVTGEVSLAVGPAIDIQGPTIVVTSPSVGEKILLNVCRQLFWSAADDGSGLAEGYSQPVLGELLETGVVGSHSVTVVARDVAGNETTLAVPYRVIYGFGGFDTPLAADGSSVFRAGETIGVKFTLVDALGLAVSGAQAQLQVARADDPGAVIATGTFHEAKAGKYVCDLQTKGLAAGAYVITAALDDGESYSVSITLE